MIADNNPFNSFEMHKFARDWNLKITISSPTYAQLNGQSERYVQTVKGLIRKTVEKNKDPNLALLAYRNTPIYGIGKSPAQLLFGQRLQDQVSTTPKLETLSTRTVSQYALPQRMEQPDATRGSSIPADVMEDNTTTAQNQNITFSGYGDNKSSSPAVEPTLSPPQHSFTTQLQNTTNQVFTRSGREVKQPNKLNL
ncbi:hypothetical protein ElyMa_003481500 [Elysia marginata]|uniref:Integrase catalytic domain-containing protein n=1 Tax=Elysia marginata TaxID=1093978 RepID=A0AAV4ECL4_9GAST|nr:hypothetical protein ElyMa_003481500 [Elysia marginata]